MSWSFRDRSMLNRILCTALALLAAPFASAAEIWWQPILGISAENDTNLDLDPGVKENIQGYVADAASIIGISTSQWTATIKPRLVYRDYPKETTDNRLEEYLDFNTSYRTQRSNASLVGSFQHLDEFDAEFTSPIFNEIGPPTGIPDTGKVTVGAAETNVLLYPKYTYSLTPILGVGVSGQYQGATYTPTDVFNHVNFENYLGKTFLSWSFSQTSDVSFGAYGTRYTALGARATGSGTSIDLNTNWSPIFDTEAVLVFQHTIFDDTSPTPLDTSVNAWGGTLSGEYKTQLDRFRLTAGRQISPSGGGTLYNVDRVQFQYDRDFSRRLSFTAAVVGLRTHALTANIVGDDRKYANARVEATWMLTPFWFVHGGYQYAFQKYEFYPQSADNNRVFIQFGYKGLGQER